MKHHSRIIPLSAALLLAAAQTRAQVITAWSFENDPVAVNNAPAPSIGSGTADSIGMNIYATPNVGITQDDVVVGKASDTGANGIANLTQTWRVRGQAGANGAANGWSSAAPIGTQGAQFAASTAGTGSSGIQVSFDWYATTQGEANLQLAYSLNVNAPTPVWNNLQITLGGSDAGLVVLNNNTSANTVMGSYVSDNLLVNGSKAGQDWFTGLTATITDPGAANDPNFGIEMVNASTLGDDVSTAGTALNNNSGNWRFDNVVISAIQAPEPSALAFTALGFAALCWQFRRRSVKQS
jgi:hypothetical protein